MSDLTSLVPRFGNLTVPPWVPFSAQAHGFRDEEYDLDLPAAAVPNASQLLSQVLPMEADADYFIRELWFIVLPTTSSAVQPTDLRVRIRDGDGHMFTNDFCYANDLSGTLCPPWPIRAGAVLIIDYENQNANTTIQVQMIVRGAKRRICENVAADLPSLYKPMRRQYPPPAPGEVHKDFAYPVEYDNLAVAPTLTNSLKFPIQMDNDADFLWRGLCGQWATRNNSLPTSGNVALTFYDANNLPFSQANLAEPWGGNYGEQRENILTNGGRIAPHYPEILVPRGGVILVDVSFGTLNDRVRFALRGVKVYREGACK